jgi:hypothetical protein
VIVSTISSVISCYLIRILRSRRHMKEKSAVSVFLCVYSTSYSLQEMLQGGIENFARLFNLYLYVNSLDMNVMSFSERENVESVDCIM